jgi:hypothetical protein
MTSRTTLYAAAALAASLVVPTALTVLPASAAVQSVPDMAGLGRAAASTQHLASAEAGKSDKAKTTPLTTAPFTPPAPMCGSSRLLAGPTKAPKGAVVVRPSEHLANVVNAHRAGTTFWLKPGVYTLGTGQYDQVDPKENDTIMGSGGVVIDGQRDNHVAFGGKATGVTLQYLEIRNFGTSILDNQSQGVVNHDAGHSWTMDHLYVHGDGGAGIFVGSGDTISNSCLSHNGQYGFSVYEPHGVSNIRIIHNEITGNNTANWEKREPGCGCAGGAKFWETRNATVISNWVHNNTGVGLWADTDNTGFLFEHNFIGRNTDVGIEYEISYNAEFIGNTFVRNAVTDGPGVGFPQPALYVSESGSDPRAGSRFGSQFLISHNRFVNNFSGVILWENANRFESSPDNSSSTARTLVNPAATLSACRTDIDRAPYINDCRWKTQNVLVTHNKFVFDPKVLPSSCTVNAGCGFNGIFSEWGTDPSWSPFQGQVVENHITYSQNNHFTDNSYVGPWHFMKHELGNDMGWKAWRAKPSVLDKASTMSLLK